MDKEQALKILKKANDLQKGKEISLAREFIAINDKVESIAEKSDKLAQEIDTKLSEISEELKKKLESELVLEIDREELKGEDGKDGEDYVLTEQDKKDIAESIKVPVVEKVIEKVEVIRETPIVTNEIKEVAVTDTAEVIVDKINALSLDEENKIDASHIKNLPGIKGGRFYGASGIKEVVAGTNITVDNSNVGYPIISATGGLSETFESVSKNLKAYPYEIAYSGGNVSTITYDLGGGMSIVKTFGYTSGDVTTVVLSGDTPTGIDLTKTIAYVGGDVDTINYS